MNTQINRSPADPAVRQRLRNIGFEPSPGSADEFVAYLRKEVANWANLVRTAGIKQD